MLYDDEYERLLTGSDVFDSWPLSRTVQDTMQIPQSHDRPINQVLYNSELNQVITVCNESVLKDGASLKLAPPEGFTTNIMKRTVVYRTLLLMTKKIEIATVETIEECLKEMKSLTTFCTRGKKYGTVEVRFANEQEAMNHSTVALRTPEWTLLLIYCGKHVARVVVQVSLQDLYKIAEEVILPEEVRLRVVEVQKLIGEKSTENVVEKYTVVKRKKREGNVDSPPKSSLKKRKENAEEAQCEGPATPRETSAEEKVKLQKQKKEKREMPSALIEKAIEKKEVWEFETGDLVYQIANAHGLNIEITSLAVEDSGYRLASGAFDGSLLIWDIGSGKWCKRMPCVASSKSMSVLTMKYFMKSSERLIIALGWNNKVKIILDSSDSNQLLILKEVSQELLDIFDHKHLIKILSTSNNTQIPNNQISVEQSYQTTHDLNSPEMSKHQTSYPENSIEISCLSLLSPDVIVLGYNNGNCVIWDIVSTNVKAILSIQHVKDSESPYRQNKEDTRVNMIKILNYKKKRSDRKHSMKLTIANKLHKRRMTIGPRNSMFQFRGSKNSHQIMGDTRKFSANISPEERREENYTEEFTNVSTQDILRPRSKQYNFNNGRNQITSDVKAPLLICNSDPVIAVIYQDDCIRFWNAKGQLLTKLKPLVKHSSNSLTCICHDNDCTILIAGDKIGYLTLWDIGKFLQQSNSEEKECFDQLTGKKCLQIEKGLQKLSVSVICIIAERKKAPIIQEVRWRAHLSAVISLSYISTSNSIISGSTDASVRVWWGTGGRFVGFFGQPRPFVFPVSEESSRYSCLPYDINEQPTKIATEKVERMFRGNAQNLEYPLVFNNERWKHSWRQNDKSEEAALTSDEFGHPAEKFFTALVKPKQLRKKSICSRKYRERPSLRDVHEIIRPFRNQYRSSHLQDIGDFPGQQHTVNYIILLLFFIKAYKHHLKTLIRGEKGADAVFRSLPLYRLETPKVPRTPELTRTTYEDKCKNMYTTRYMKRTSKGRCSRRSIDVRGFRQVTTNYLPSIRKLSRVSFDVPSHSSNIFS
uniref:Uncharacterized protein n=1 Tax=Octopus bimaculoides TaxID=37653 RepID=A0A0L8I7X9_OCTBM